MGNPGDIKTRGCTIGIDLGGTKVTAGLVSAGGQVLTRERVLLPAGQDDGAVLQAIGGVIAAVLDGARRAGHAVRALGLGIPAIADGQPGRSTSACCPNLLLLERCDLAQHLGERFGLPVGVANDANCFALGEHHAGAGAGTRDMVGITLGTGLGCGVIIGGRLHLGSRGCAGEIWDAPLPGGGIIEDLVCGAAVAKRAEYPAAGAAATAARAGNTLALEAWREYGAHLALALAWVERVLDPELFVIGGSISQAWDLIEPVMTESRANGRGPRQPVHVSRLGEDAALIGASRIAECRLQNAE